MSNADDILKNTKPTKKSRSVAANQVRFKIRGSEVVADLFYLEPNPPDPEHPEAIYIQQVKIPAEIGRDFANGLSQAVADWETSQTEVTDIEKDPANMSQEELIESVKSLFGTWADRDDIGDDWVENLRREADASIDGLHDPDTD